MAEADAFHLLAHDRRQGLWRVRGLGERPLPLSAAADEAEAAFRPEANDIGRAQGATAALNGVVRQLRLAGLHPDGSGSAPR